MRRKDKIKLLLAGILFFVMLIPAFSYAASIIPPDCAGSQYGNECGLDDLVSLFANLYRVGLRYIGALALLFFVVGGFILLVSGGKTDRVELGKKILAGTVIGVVIVMGGFLAVQYIETSVLSVNSAFVIKSSQEEQCRGKPDGTVCSLYAGEVDREQNVFACVSGICMPISQCDWKAANDNSFLGYACRDISGCNEDSIVRDLCPGGRDFVCCKEK